MIRRPPRSTRTDTLFPYTTLFRSEALQRVPVQADDLAQQLGRQHRLPVLFMLGDDLQQHLPGQVIAALGVADLEVLAVDDQLADILDGDVAGDVGVVEATVRVFLDDARLGHGAKALTDAYLQHGAVQHGLKEAGTGGWGLARTSAAR